MLTGARYDRCIRAPFGASAGHMDDVYRRALTARSAVSVFIPGGRLDKHGRTPTDLSMSRLGWTLSYERRFNGIIVRRYSRGTKD
jgi:hypothetical protein